MRYDGSALPAAGSCRAFSLVGLALDTLDDPPRSDATIILTEDALITDYVLIAGPGAALINSALVTAISIPGPGPHGSPLNGMSLVVIGLMSGFSLFGKNFVNIWPILLGSWLYAKLRKEPFGKYAPSACCPPPWLRSSAISHWITAGEPPAGRSGGGPHRVYFAPPLRLYL